MKVPKDTGGPAFPQFEVMSGERDGHGDMIDAYTCATGGMTLRDWFAGQALSGILSGDLTIDSPIKIDGKLNTIGAVYAYQYADAMLRVRSRDD
jgi:hypothetical protein